MTNIRSVCVYCGSGNGIDPAYVATAEALGRAFAQRGIRLVYGGGSIGLMGTVARGALANGGQVTGIIPQFLRDREVMLLEVDELIVTGDMHERKRLMFERADAFVALPGGIGTLEEVVEMMTWAQLGRHAKPIVLVNVNDFWSPLVHLIEHMRAQAFIRPGLDIHFDMVPDAATAIDLLTRHVAAGDDGETAVLDRL